MMTSIADGAEAIGAGPAGPKVLFMAKVMPLVCKSDGGTEVLESLEVTSGLGPETSRSLEEK
jgi:hypothetical protein